MIKFYDNIISKDLQDKIENNLSSNNYAWFLNNDTVGYTGRPLDMPLSKVKEYLQFTHLYYAYDNDKKVCVKNSNDTENIDNLINEINDYFKWPKCEVYRVKANLQTQFTDNDHDYYNTPHIDFFEMNLLSCIYYVNDSDGDTLFFDSSNKLNVIERVSPKKGRFVLFDGNILHTGQHPIKNKKRMVVNINLRSE